MSDILLSPTAMDKALEDGGKEYIARYEATLARMKAGEVVTFPNEYHVKAEVICRAQVAKIDTELFAPWERRLAERLDMEGYVEHRARLDVALRTVQVARQALRVAGGGE